MTKQHRVNSRQRLTTSSNNRLFLFIDESGDTGLPSTHSSLFFMLNILICDTANILKVEKHFSRYRYLRDADKEFKKYKNNTTSSQDILEDLCIHISKLEGVHIFSLYLEKIQYIGPYLNTIDKTKKDYDATKFRNFILKIALEKVFEKCEVVKLVDGDFRSIELVIDRYLESKDGEENLKKYLQNNYNLPRIQFITQADSLYCLPLQVADIIGTMTLQVLHEKNNRLGDYIQIIEMNNPRNLIERKRP